MNRYPKWQMRQFSLVEDQVLAFEEQGWLHDPILYLLIKDTQLFVGWTIYLQHDLLEQLAGWQEAQVYLFKHDHLTESALKSFETQLINGFLAEGSYQIANRLLTHMRVQHDYYQAAYYRKDLFKEIWKLLLELGLVSLPLQEVRNQDAYKLSPYHDLSWDQLALEEEILKLREKKEKQLIFLKGEAGTGKSLLLSTLYTALTEKKEQVQLLVNHKEVAKTYQGLTQHIKTLAGQQVLSPEDFIKKGQSVPIILVDEGHLLWKRKEGSSQLEDLLEFCDCLICVFDPFQILHLASHSNLEDLIQELDPNLAIHDFELRDQMRMRSSQIVWNWVDALVKERRIEAIPLDQSGKNLFEFKIMKDATDLKGLIHYRDQHVGLSRMVASFDYEAGSLVDPDGLALPWAPMEAKETWAQQEDSLDQVGSIYNIQGFDLNYVGVVLGPSFSYDKEQDRLLIDSELFCDPQAFKGQQEASILDKERVILNSLNVLMKRGVKGLYVYAVDPTLRAHLLDLQEQAMLSRKHKEKIH